MWPDLKTSKFDWLWVNWFVTSLCVRSYLCPWDWAEGIGRPHHRLSVHHGGLGHHGHGAHLRGLERNKTKVKGIKKPSEQCIMLVTAVWDIVFVSGTLNTKGLRSSSVDIIFCLTVPKLSKEECEPVWTHCSHLIWLELLFNSTWATWLAADRKSYNTETSSFVFGATHIFWKVLTLKRKKAVVHARIGLEDPKWMSHNSSYVSADAVIEKRNLRPPSSL